MSNNTITQTLRNALASLIGYPPPAMRGLLVRRLDGRLKD